MQSPSIEDQNSDSIDLVKYLVLIWHWAWLICLAAIVAATVAYFVSKMIPPTYQAKTTLLVDMAASNQSIDYSSVQLSSQLTQTYAQMMTKSPVLSEVALRLGLSGINPKAITAKPVTNTQLINITAEAGDPILAANIANTLVTAFSDQVQSLQTARFADSEQSFQTQMADTQNKIKEANDQLSASTDQTEKNRLEALIANYSQTYAGLLQSYEQVRLAEAQNRSSIIQVEPASIPIGPIRPKIFINVFIAALIGALLAGGVIIVGDLLNDTVKTPEEISEKSGLPVVGVISHYKQMDGKPITESEPMSLEAEAFRKLRTNVNYFRAGIDEPLNTIMITSAMPGEGKTDVLINLGIVMVQNDLKVLPMDADLRRPAIHNRLGLCNLIGLSQHFVNPELDIDYLLQPTRINGLNVLTSGDSPPNPSELLGSKNMNSLLQKLKPSYDVILIDTPPALAVADAAVVLPFVDGVIVVVKPGSTHMAELLHTIEMFTQMNGKVLGIVLNNVNFRSPSYGYYYKNYKSYNGYRDNDRNKSNNRKIDSNPKLRTLSNSFTKLRRITGFSPEKKYIKDWK